MLSRTNDYVRPAEEATEEWHAAYRRRGYLCLAGGVLIQMFNGCFFLWANISIYVLSYIYIYDKSVD